MVLKDKVPSFVGKLCLLTDAWIVGSAAFINADLKKLRDWDVLIPFAKWSLAAGMIPSNATPNTFGGWKISSFGSTIDIWPGDLSEYLQRSTGKAIWHFGTGKRFIAL